MSVGVVLNEKLLAYDSDEEKNDLEGMKRRAIKERHRSHEDLTQLMEQEEKYWGARDLKKFRKIETDRKRRLSFPSYEHPHWKEQSSNVYVV